MNAENVRTYEMAQRVLNQMHLYPDPEAGGSALVARLMGLVARMGEVNALQRGGVNDSHAGSVRKQAIRRAILEGPIAHLAEVGALAAAERAEMRGAFRVRKSATRYHTLLTVSRAMLAEARTHRELLVRHGMSESLLEELAGQIEELDAACTLASAGRTAHTAATRELDALGKAIGQVVRAMDARNRRRFQGDRQALEQWISARTPLGVPRGAKSPEPSAGGDVRPAA